MYIRPYNVNWKINSLSLSKKSPRGGGRCMEQVIYIFPMTVSLLINLILLVRFDQQKRSQYFVKSILYVKKYILGMLLSNSSVLEDNFTQLRYLIVL